MRVSSASAYYGEKVANRPNLHLITEALVEKIVLEKIKTEGESETEQIRATGVLISTATGTHTVHAQKEVVVCCGAVKSPQCLELSGIGSADLLAQHGIEVFVDNKQVGENLQ